MRYLLRLICVAVLAVNFSACSNPPYPRGSLETLYPQPPRPSLQQLVVQGHVLHYAEMAGADARPRLLFIHGSPGDWKAWAPYLVDPALDGFGSKIAVDRPGFGESDAGKVVTDLQAQSELLAQLLPPGTRTIVVGHSLGGPLAAWLTIDHPDRVCGAVMVAGSVAADFEGLRWYNQLADWRLLQWIIPREMIDSNHEIFQLQAQLRKLDAAWPRLQRPLIAIQGLKDELVDPRTVDYLEKRVPATLLTVRRITDQGHFVLWKRPDIVTKAIRDIDCKM